MEEMKNYLLYTNIVYKDCLLYTSRETLKINSKSKNFLEFEKINNLVILNGHTKSDEEGEYALVSNSMGLSVLDSLNCQYFT